MSRLLQLGLSEFCGEFQNIAQFRGVSGRTLRFGGLAAALAAQRLENLENCYANHTMQVTVMMAVRLTC